MIYVVLCLIKLLRFAIFWTIRPLSAVCISLNKACQTRRPQVACLLLFCAARSSSGNMHDVQLLHVLVLMSVKFQMHEISCIYLFKEMQRKLISESIIRLMINVTKTFASAVRVTGH